MPRENYFTRREGTDDYRYHRRPSTSSHSSSSVSSLEWSRHGNIPSNNRSSSFHDQRLPRHPSSQSMERHRPPSPNFPRRQYGNTSSHFDDSNDSRFSRPPPQQRHQQRGHDSRLNASLDSRFYQGSNRVVDGERTNQQRSMPLNVANGEDLNRGRKRTWSATGSSYRDESRELGEGNDYPCRRHHDTSQAFSSSSTTTAKMIETEMAPMIHPKLRGRFIPPTAVSNPVHRARIKDEGVGKACYRSSSTVIESNRSGNEDQQPILPRVISAGVENSTSLEVEATFRKLQSERQGELKQSRCGAAESILSTCSSEVDDVNTTSGDAASVMGVDSVSKAQSIVCAIVDSSSLSEVPSTKSAEERDEASTIAGGQINTIAIPAIVSSESEGATPDLSAETASVEGLIAVGGERAIVVSRSLLAGADRTHGERCIRLECVTNESLVADSPIPPLQAMIVQVHPVMSQQIAPATTGSSLTMAADRNSANCSSACSPDSLPSNESRKGERPVLQAGDCQDVSLVRVGSRLSVYWDGENNYFDGTVTKERPGRKRRFFIRYDDGDREWINLERHRFRLLEEADSRPTPLQNTSTKSTSEKKESPHQEIHRRTSAEPGDWVAAGIRKCSSDSSDTETDEEEVMAWACKMFGIPPRQSIASKKPRGCKQSSPDLSSWGPVHIPISEAVKLGRRRGIQIQLSPVESDGKSAEIQVPEEPCPLAMEVAGVDGETKRRRCADRPLSTEEITAILGDEIPVQGRLCTNWVRRSVRQPCKSALNAAPVRALIEKLRTNDTDMVILKLKKYLPDLGTPQLVIDATLDALAENTNCEALYIQNFNEGMRDEQVLRLLEVLQLPSCKIWCLNIGETYNVKSQTWQKFADGLKYTKVTHMYASEHTITPDLKDQIRNTIRDNRGKHSMHNDPDNLDTIVRCTHCWWNPINAKKLRPYLKRRGYEHILLDREVQGLRGTISGATLS